jgi:pimeloyl-ACP methyl ester carboxylesterase
MDRRCRGDHPGELVLHDAIETRELITVTVGGNCLRGTYHRPPDHGSDSRLGPGENIRIGVLFLNSGFMPRASGGDAAVYWAVSFAKCGYPSFRFDLPGLGDSDGEPPRKRLDFAKLVNNGHYAPFVSSIAENLTERFNLSGVVLVGHCAGAVTAIYAAATSKQVKGLVIVDPYFFREEPKRTKFRNEISLWVTQDKEAKQLSNVYRRLKKLNQLAGGNALPANANSPLIRCWSRLASAGVPMLILNARGPRSRVGEFDYLGYLEKVSGPGHRLSIKFVDGANHSFADNVGRAEVRRQSENWLNACFPLNACVPLAERGKVAALNGERFRTVGN